MVDETGELLPRKRRWPLMLAAVAGLVALLVAAGYLYSLHWQRKVEALLASYRAKGEPVTWEDILAARDKLPAEQNSALVLQDALMQIEARGYSPGRTLDSLLGADGPDARPSARTLGLLRADLKDHEPALSIIRSGAALSSGVYPLQLTENPYDMTYPHLQQLRSAVQLCGREAIARACAGDGEGAAESLVNARRLCASLGECWVYIEELVRLASDGLMVAGIEKSLNLREFPRAAIRDLRDELAAEEVELSLRRALLGERAMAHTFLARMGASGLLKEMGDRNWYTDLMMESYDFVPGKMSRELLFYFGVIDLYLPITDQPMREQVVQSKRVARSVEDELYAHSYKHFLAVNLLPPIDRAMSELVRARVRLQVADTALAVEEWRLKYGRWPETLDELVPGLLKAVPEDPFAEGKVRYVRTERGVTVYSLGPDGTDNGGIPLATSGAGDLPFHLLNPELRGAVQMTFADEVKKSGVAAQDLTDLGVTAEEIRALGLDGGKE